MTVANRADAIEVAHEAGLPVIELVIEGLWKEVGLEQFQMRTVEAAIASGVDGVCLAGDGWIGGPACGLLIGKSGFIEQRRKIANDLVGTPHLPACLRYWWLSKQQVHQSPGNHPRRSLATASVENLENRAQRMSVQLNAFENV